MSKVKRIRVFAGPNGSGKSTLFNDFEKIIHPVRSVNADVIEKALTETGIVDLANYDVIATQEDFIAFCETRNAQSLIDKANRDGYRINLTIKENALVDKSKETHSYEAALASLFIREKLCSHGKSFAFETVMSHPSKIDELRDFKQRGYKIYFYFICLDDPELNVRRVQDRIEKGGHAVDFNKVRTRYSDTLENLLPALKLSDRAFLFDNSGEEMKSIAEKEQDRITILEDEELLPDWFIRYVVNRLG